MSDEPNAGPDYVFPDKPAYSVPPTVDYTLLNQIDTPDEPYAYADHADGPGDIAIEDELPPSDYSEEMKHDDDSV